MTLQTPLAVFMVAAGLTDAATAKLLDVSPMTVRSWRIGSQRKPREAHQKKVVATFGHPLLLESMNWALAVTAGEAWAARANQLKDSRTLAAQILTSTSLEDAKELASKYLTPSDQRIVRFANIISKLPSDDSSVDTLLVELNLTQAELGFLHTLIGKVLVGVRPSKEQAAR